MKKIDPKKQKGLAALKKKKPEVVAKMGYKKKGGKVVAKMGGCMMKKDPSMMGYKRGGKKK